MRLRLNPELSHNVWKLAYPIILGNLSHILLGVHLGLGLLGAWSAEAIYNLIPALLMALRFKGGSWKEIRI
ncbi:MAG: hypothetical protein J7K13_04785 [Thermoplasmata archaeon]|nr:hypothetical protein [Thermoplasmata archaeon]